MTIPDPHAHTRISPQSPLEADPTAGRGGDRIFSPHRHFEMLPNSFDRKILSPHELARDQSFLGESDTTIPQQASRRIEHAHASQGSLRRVMATSSQRSQASGACSSWSGCWQLDLSSTPATQSASQLVEAFSSQHRSIDINACRIGSCQQHTGTATSHVHEVAADERRRVLQQHALRASHAS